MNALAKYLSEHLKDHGKQFRLARAIGSSPGTVNKWLSDENTPNFENCLRIAAYFGIDPARIFRMAGKVDYYQLYRQLFKKADYHTRLHLKLQRLLDMGHEAVIDQFLLELEAEEATQDGQLKVSGED